MKKLFFISAISFLLTTNVSAQKANKVDTLQVTTTPQMHCSGCENKIKSNLRFVKGIKKIETSVCEQKVTISYDNRKCDYKTLEAAFQKIGYTIKRYDVTQNNK